MASYKDSYFLLEHRNTGVSGPRLIYRRSIVPEKGKLSATSSQLYQGLGLVCLDPSWDGMNLSDLELRNAV